MTGRAQSCTDELPGGRTLRMQRERAAAWMT